MKRRSLLRAGGLGALLTSAAACTEPTQPTQPAASVAPTAETSSQDTLTSAKPSSATASSGARSTLLVYFSRPGENYYYGGRTDLQVGNTEVLAQIISDLADCDVHRIEEVDTYPAGYDETVERNRQEQADDARPGIADPPAGIERYSTVLIGSPVWNSRTPMIMSTFTEAHDFTGKTVHPFVTYAVSGLGGVAEDYAESCPGAVLGEALAVQGEEVGESRDDVEAWLRTIGLLDT